MNWSKERDGITTLVGSTTYFPYTRLNGEVPIEAFWVIQSAQRENINELCQFRWFWSTVLLIILINFLFVDSAKPFPYG